MGYSGALWHVGIGLAPDGILYSGAERIHPTPGRCRVTHRNVDGVEPVNDGDHVNLWHVIKTTMEYESCCQGEWFGPFEIRTTKTTECWIQGGEWGGCGEGED